jgi:O-antigen ligase
MKTNIERLLQIEFYALCALGFSLPLFEGLKHIFCLIFLGFFTYRTLKYRRDFSTPPIGKYFLIFISASIISSIGAAYNGYNVEKLHDIIRFSLIGWMILHTPLSKKKSYLICAILTASTLIACSESYYFLKTGQEKYFELRSVGHTNHSSIFILLTIGLTLPALLTNKASKLIWTLLLTTNLLIIHFLFTTNSRATFIGLAIIFTLFIITTMIRHKTLIPITLTICALLIAGITIKPPNTINKFIKVNKYYSGKLTPREKSWNTSYYAWKKEMLFGVGYGNYRAITEEKMAYWYQDTNIDFTDKKRFIYLSHAHNRYINTLSEGGAIGILGLLTLLGGIIFHLIINIRNEKNNGQ